MSRLFQAAAAASLFITASGAIALTAPGAAQSAAPVDQSAGESAAITNAVLTQVQPGDTVFTPAPSADAGTQDDNAARDTVSPHVEHRSSLDETVRAVTDFDPESSEMRCLATGVFFESKGEPLPGQLAVAHVILNRARSGRFASTVCGVLTQRGQFSFVRGGAVPTAPANAQWRTAVAIARIAMDGDWASPAPGALFFHAARVSPGWNRSVIARLGNHVFYR